MNFEQTSSLFLDESRELLVKAEQALLKLENDPLHFELVHEVFRALHTIKGSAAMFGFKAVSDFTHEIENIFDKVRKEEQAISKETIDLGLKAVDHISQLLSNTETAVPEWHLPSTTKSPSQQKTIRIRFVPQPQILHRGVRLESLFSEVAQFGPTTIVADTSKIPDLETLEPTEILTAWTIDVTTDAAESHVRSAFMFVEDYAHLEFEILEPTKSDHPLSPKKNQPTAAPLPSTTSLEASTIRVRKEKLDALIDTVGELVILQARLEQESRAEMNSAILSISETLTRLTSDLRDITMKIRMVPLEELFSSYHRLVRDLAASLGKEIQLVLVGASTELDKNLIESLKDPLLHIIRNSADHGIETPDVREKLGKPRWGTIGLKALQVGSKVSITVSDDGSGLDVERIKKRAVERNLLPATETDENRIFSMIFEPGFSTAEVTTDVSGRGVGMDVVKKNVELLHGEIDLQSEPGKGTEICLSIPLTLVIVDGLWVKVGNVDYIVSFDHVQECVDMTKELFSQFEKQRWIDLRGKPIPVISIRDVFSQPERKNDLARLVIVTIDGTTAGLLVDSILGKQQVVIKPLSQTIRKLKTISGATIMGDGSVALILNVSEILKTQIKKSNHNSEVTV